MIQPMLRAALAADIPALLWGAPGTGKTSLLLALAREQGAHVETLIGSTLDPVDVGGYLLPTRDGVRAEPPPWVRRLEAVRKRDGRAWLFLDELSCAPASVRAVLLRVVHERVAGEISLRGVRMVAASNPVDTAADGGDLDPATASRWAHFDFAPDPAQWIAGSLSGWGGTPSTSRALASVCGWISRSSAALLGDPSERGYPTPRSWTAAARLCDELPDEHWTAAAASCVGAAAAGEWSTWRASQNLPDPEELLAGRASLPERPDQLSTALLNVAQCALADRPDRATRLEALDALLGRVRPDQALLAARVIAGAAGVDLPQGIRKLGLKMRSV